jgi:hypothetical protein
MLYPHSLLWHYLWLGPHILQMVLAVLLWRRGINKLFPVFFVYIVYEAIEELTLYAMDVSPLFSVRAWWIACCIAAVIEGLLKFAVVWEVFSNLLRPRPSQTRLAKTVIVGAGGTFFAVAVWAAIHAPIAIQFPLASYAHILGQSTYMITCGLWLSTFLLAAFFHLEWNRWALGIAMGAGISSCVHLATWAVFANAGWFKKEYLLDFLNMGTYHVCVLLWFYYLVWPIGLGASVPGENYSDPVARVPDRFTVRRLLPALFRAN